MTRATSARLAGVTYLLYIALAFPAMVLFDRATRAQGTPAKLARLAQHASDVRITVVLSLVTCFAAFVLAVTLYAITRDEDRDLALLALTCRVGEGVLNAMLIVPTMGLLWLATAGTEAGAPDASAANALGAFLLKSRAWGTTTSAALFAVGSTIFSYLLLRGRMVPVPLAWLGVLASVLVAVLLPAQLAGVVRGPVLDVMWLPMLAFEIALGLWLLVKGVARMPAQPARATALTG
ncbi:MAG TPA: DUF4386 domain-containing protein [Gemmatimonadaceae bacterium]|nr:DUF4386 domain-containing protein [Gemmatimonadaceae bacterium]